MCDYSLEQLASRPAKVGDELIVYNFGTGTRGFADALACRLNPLVYPVAVCLASGTELVFAQEIQPVGSGGRRFRWKTAIFRELNIAQPHMHHDALEFPDGGHLLLTYLVEGQTATVLQLPAERKVKVEATGACENVPVHISSYAPVG